MERLTFGAPFRISSRDPQLDRVAITPLTTSLQAGSSTQAAVFRISPGGRIVRHPAAVPQILAVLAGHGRVSGADGRFESIKEGEAVFWAAGEEHETQTDAGLTALILEADGLLPFRTSPTARTSKR